MEAHAGTVTIRTGQALKPRSRRLADLITAIRRRRMERAQRAYRLRANGAQVRSVPGSDHAHLIRPPRAF